MGPRLLVRVSAVVHMAFQSGSIYREGFPPVARIEDLCCDLVRASCHLDVFPRIGANVSQAGTIFEKVS